MRMSRAALAATVLALSASVGVAPPSRAEARPSASAAAPLETVLNWSGPLTAERAKPIEMAGWIAARTFLPDGDNGPSFPLPEGTELTARRIDLATPSGKPLGTVRTDAAGRFTLTDTPPAGGRVAYHFSYAGNDQFAPVSGAFYTEVSRLKPVLSVNRNNSVNAYGSTVTVTASPGAALKGRTVEFWVDPYGADVPSRLAKRVSVDSAGRAAVGVKLSRNTWVTARFLGDAVYEPVSTRVNLWTKAAVSTKLTRHYKTKKVGSRTYHYFRKSKNPRITHTMNPFPGREARTVIQHYRGGEWRLWSGRYTMLSAGGKAAFTFVTAAKAGTKFRVRAEYVGMYDGDEMNYNTQGAWKYFTFTR